MIGLSLSLSLGGGNPSAPFSATFTSSLPGSVTFTRASTGTYFNSSGVLSSAAIDVARIDTNPSTLAARGLLIEESRTNGLTYSEQLDNAAWTKGSGTVVTANQATAPDGATTADLVVGDGGGGGIYNNAAIGASLARTRSVYMRSVSGTCTVTMKDPGLTVGVVNCDLTTTWQRFTLSETTTGLGLWVANIPAGGIYMWGAQIEVGGTVSSYIPTVAATATRAVDAASFTVPAGVGTLTYTFDDNTTQTVAVSPGAYSIPTTLNRAWIKSIVGSA